MQIEGSAVLVTGANGFVGTRLARRLAEAGAKVQALVRRPGEIEELTKAGVIEIVGDFVDESVAKRAAADVDVVVHTAATIGPDIEPVRMVNAAGTRSMIAAARATGARRFVQISTVAVYDLVANPQVVNEDALVKTEGDPYGVTKAEADAAVLEAMTTGLRATILRPVQILGVHPTSTWAVMVPKRVRDEGTTALAINGRVIDGSNTWSWVHVENLADALFLVVEKEAAVGRVYNVVDGQTTWREFTDDIRRWFGRPPIDAKSKEVLPGHPLWTGRYSADRIRRELGWTPRLTYADGMKEAEAYWRARETPSE
jgi:nucleoside-diphosphate-sugar epimerase